MAHDKGGRIEIQAAMRGSAMAGPVGWRLVLPLARLRARVD